ncbi:hypothetical protein CEXT_31511 [Caerostris extrusa]|uniref:Uncharacterized protein n=1 Tax=Caerostris extrusa TaxID=172846 RepID=A0AAV4Q5T6_CAEEX|nr:hypothetical protein CEXT_31511 [Caerostris extrusa]
MHLCFLRQDLTFSHLPLSEPLEKLLMVDHLQTIWISKLRYDLDIDLFCTRIDGLLYIWNKYSDRHGGYVGRLEIFLAKNTLSIQYDSTIFGEGVALGPYCTAAWGVFHPLAGDHEPRVSITPPRAQMKPPPRRIYVQQFIPTMQILQTTTLARALGKGVRVAAD